MFCLIDGNKVLDTADGVLETFSKADIKKVLDSGIRLHRGIPDIKVVKSDLDISNSPRTLAVMLINGVVYEGDTHQECLYYCMKEQRGIDIYKQAGLDVNEDDLIEPFLDQTFDMFEGLEAYGFDIFSNMYLIAHNLETARRTIDWMRYYTKANDLEMYSFTSYDSDIVEVL